MLMNLYQITSLFVLTDNYISHFKYRLIMNNKQKNKWWITFIELFPK